MSTKSIEYQNLITKYCDKTTTIKSTIKNTINYFNLNKINVSQLIQLIIFAL